MATWKISLEGDKKLQAAMRDIETKLGRKVFRASVRDGAKLIHRQARADAPIMGADQRVGPSTQMPNPGTLRKGTKVLTSKEKKKHHYRVNVVVVDRSKMGIPEDSPHYAPMAIEVGRRGFKKFGPAKATRFMHNAYIKKRKSADEIIIRKIKRGVLSFWKQNTLQRIRFGKVKG